MKTLPILPIFASSAIGQNSHFDDERGFNGYGQFSSISEYSEECSNQVPSKGGIFETTNDGLRGEITLDNYKTKLRCKHAVQAEDDCSEITVRYRSVAVNAEEAYECNFDSFRFGWTEEESDELTPPRCNCFGDGCSHDIMGKIFDYLNSFKYDFRQKHLGPEEFTIASNSFTFYFESGVQYKWDENDDMYEFSYDGHVMLDWECTEYEMTTTSIKPTTTTTSTTTFTTTSLTLTT